MLPGFVQAWARGLAENIVLPLARRGVTPNMVTLLGFLFNVVTAIIIATDHLTAGGVMLLLSGAFDMLDGALARVAKRQTVFGAFLDSLLDRYSEASILLAVIYVFTVRGDTAAVLLSYAVAVGSILISYARARAEGLGLECKVGIAPRPERVILLGIGLLFGGWTLIAVLGVLAVLTHFTAMQRLYHVWQQTQHRADSRPSATTQRQETPTS